MGCVKLAINIQPVCVLNPSRDSYDGENVTAVGWGHLGFEKSNHTLAGIFPNVLQDVNIKVLNNTSCAVDRPDLLCAGDPIEWNKDACKFDSGGNVCLFFWKSLAGLLFKDKPCALEYSSKCVLLN